MTDQELIQLLQEKSAGELTPAEIDAVRARWTQSPELRQALVEHLHLESQLTGALGPVQLDVDSILQRASEQQRVTLGSASRWSWLLGLCLLLFVGTGLLVFWGAARQQQQLATNDPLNSSNEDNPSPDRPTTVEDDQPVADAMLAANFENPPASAAVLPGESPQPAPKPAPVDVAANEPWAAALSREVAPWAANSPKLTTEYKTAGHEELTDAEAKRWLAPVEGHPFGWATDSTAAPVRRIARFHGLAKLRAPWPKDAVLRATPLDVTSLTLYFWNGPTGVALRFYTRREPHLWAAFEISRENSSPIPTRWGLLTTDNGSYTRSTPGMVDIRQQGDELVLARGGIILLSVPFVGPPIEVYVEGQFRLRGLSMYRSVPFLTPPPNPHAVVIAGPAATLPWAISAEGSGSFTNHDDGSLSMTVDSRDKTGIISLPFGWLLATQQSTRATGLFEVIVNVESADPGTGIFLGDRNGRPVQQLGFFRDAATKQITFGLLRPGEVRADANYNRDDFPPPYLAKSGWIKLIAGLGNVHLQTSGDGVHWGHVVENPGRDLPGAVASVGLFGFHGPAARTIRVRQIQVRELTGITQIADQRLRPLIAQFTPEQMRDLSTWSHHVLDTQPAGVDAPTWFATSAVAALSQGPPKEFGAALLRELVTIGMKSDFSFDQKRRMLDDACSLSDLFDEASAKTLGVWYEELGWQLAQSGDADPLAKLRPVWLWSPIWTISKMRYVWERLHSHEIIEAVYRRNWSKVWTLSQAASYWNLLPNPDLKPTERGEELDRHARWAKTLAAEAVPQLDDGSAGIMPLALRHPLAPVLNKEAYNVRAELQSALSGQTYEDACRIVMSIEPHDGPGLLPDIEDRELFVSMPTAIATALKVHPGFAETMTEKFGPLGQIRVRAAINRQDRASLQSATLQFMGTDAARDAHAWLGDTALSIGQFEIAEYHFRHALSDASNLRRETLEPRLILSRALGGRLSAETLPASLTPISARSFNLNGTAVSRADFEAVIRDLVARPAIVGSVTESKRIPDVPLPQSAYKLEPRGQFDGHPGNNPGRGEFHFGDPFGRQLSAVADDRMIYVSNRFQVNAYGLPAGQQVWAQGLGAEQGEAYALPFTPMKPLLAGDRLFVRRLTKAGAELACLNSADGHVIWHQRPSHSVLTDPVIWNGRLFAMVLSKVDDDLVQVEACWFDPLTGTTTSSRPLFRLREVPDRQFSGQFTLNDRNAVCTLSGTTASFDSQGEMLWLRRHTIMQKPVDEHAEDVRVAAPLIHAGHTIVSIPGVREICCLDVDTGRRVWERPMTNLRGIAAMAESRVLVDTLSGLVALDANTGQVAWTYPVESRLEALAVSGPTLMVTHRATGLNNKSKPMMAWLDLQTGKELRQTLVDVAERDECQFGPMFCAGGKWWSFLGQTWKDPKRQLHEFNSVPVPVLESIVDDTLLSWRPQLLDAQAGEIASVVPGWFPVANYRDRIVLHPADIRGETFSLISKVDPLHEIRFTHRVNLAADRKTTLRLRVGNQPGQKWKLTVRASNRTLLEQDIDDTGSPNGWRDINVDLGPLSGQTVVLQLIQSAAANTPADALWKRAELLVQ